MKWRGRAKSSNIVDRRHKTVIKTFLKDSLASVKTSGSYTNSYNKFRKK